MPVLVLAVLVASAACWGGAKAARTPGRIAADVVPAWISISVPPVTRRFVPAHSRLPPQIEQVLMLRLERDPEAAAAAAVEALLAGAPWKRDREQAPAVSLYAQHAAGFAALTLLPLVVAIRRLRRLRRD